MQMTQIATSNEQDRLDEKMIKLRYGDYVGAIGRRVGLFNDGAVTTGTVTNMGGSWLEVEAGRLSGSYRLVPQHPSGDARDVYICTISR